MPASALFGDSFPYLWACWLCGPNDRMLSDRNRTGKVTYTARLILVTEGEVVFRSGGRDLPTVPGTVLYLPPSCLYDSDFRTDAYTSLNFFFDFDSDGPDRERPADARIVRVANAETAEAALFRPFAGFADAPELSAPFAVRSDPGMEALAEAIMTESREPDPFAAVRARALLTDLLVRILRRKRGDGAPRSSETYRRIADYVEEHLSDKLSGRELAEALNYHPNYMNRVVKAAAGLNLHQFVLRAKLRRAEWLLAFTELPVADIAQSLAFCDSGHFARVFSAHRGVTPNVFRSSSGQV